MVETGLTTMAALAPFLAIWILLRATNHLARRRDACVARQIALTDAIHRELGAAAAPVVELSWSREWIVSVRVPLQREGLVGTITRITHDVFRRLDRQDAPRLRLVLRPQDPRPARAMHAEAARSAGQLSQAA
jgi:hypothetical protein